MLRGSFGESFGKRKVGNDRKINYLEQGVGTTEEPDRCQESDGDCHDDKNSERKMAMDPEEDEIWNSSDFNLQAKAYIANLLHTRKRLMKINVSLQQSLNASEDRKDALQIEYATLMKQLKSMRKLEENHARMLEEMNKMQSTIAEGKMTNTNLNTQNNQLQKEIGAMQNQIETMNNKMCDILHAKEMVKKKFTDVNQMNKALQQQLELATMQLHDQEETILKKELVIQQQNSSLEELNTILQVMKEKNTNLESQLELALLTRKGSILNPDGTVVLAAESCMSVAEELGLEAGFLQKFSDEVNGCEDFDVQAVEKSQSVTPDLNEAVNRSVSSEIETVEVTSHGEVMKCEHVKEDRLQDSKENITVEEVEKVLLNDTKEVMTSEQTTNHMAVDNLTNTLQITPLLEDVAEVVRPGNAKITHLMDVMDIIEPEEVKINDVVVVVDPLNEISNHKDVGEVSRPTELRTVKLETGVKFTGSEETKTLTNLQVVKDKLPECVHSQEEKDDIMQELAVEIPKHEDTETVIRPDVDLTVISPHIEMKAQVVERANFSSLEEEEELAADQNSNLWLDESFKNLRKGALVVGAIGLGALILWKLKN